MPAQPVEVARNAWGAILHHPVARILELKWFSSSGQMTDDDFKSTLELYTTQAERLQPIPFMLIDGTEFRHTFGDNDGVMAWRGERIIPRYNTAGVTRFAFQLPAGAPGTVETGGAPAVEQGANFPT